MGDQKCRFLSGHVELELVADSPHARKIGGCIGLDGERKIFSGKVDRNSFGNKTMKNMKAGSR